MVVAVEGAQARGVGYSPLPGGELHPNASRGEEAESSETLVTLRGSRAALV
jgi:hypothetical protein